MRASPKFRKGVPSRAGGPSAWEHHKSGQEYCLAREDRGGESITKQSVGSTYWGRVSSTREHREHWAAIVYAIEFLYLPKRILKKSYERSVHGREKN